MKIRHNNVQTVTNLAQVGHLLNGTPTLFAAGEKIGPILLQRRLNVDLAHRLRVRVLEVVQSVAISRFQGLPRVYSVDQNQGFYVFKLHKYFRASLWRPWSNYTCSNQLKMSIILRKGFRVSKYLQPISLIGINRLESLPTRHFC